MINIHLSSVFIYVQNKTNPENQTTLILICSFKASILSTNSLRKFSDPNFSKYWIGVPSELTEFKRRNLPGVKLASNPFNISVSAVIL